MIHQRLIHLGILLFLIFSEHLPIATAENWPMWRGPRQNGTSQEKELPLKWSRTENVAWRFPLPGAAPSTPVIWQDKIFLTTTLRGSEQVMLLCLDTQGMQIWQRDIGQGTSEQLEKNNHAAPSPSTDGQHVWTLTSNGTLTCHDLSGNQKWQFDVRDRYEKIDMPWGMASSPLLHRDHLYVQLFHLGSSRVIALDKLSGKEVWNVDRETDAQGKCMRSYATPTIFPSGNREYLLTHGQDYIVAHDLETGNEVGRCGDFHPAAGYDSMMHVSSSPVVADGFLLVPSGANGNFQVLRGDGLIDIKNNPDYRIWSDHISPKRPSALLVDSLVYICSESGVLHCLNVNSGKTYYHRAAHRHTHHASPVHANGKIYLTARDGTVTVVAAGTEFNILTKNSLNEPTCASPAISGGRIYFRTFEALYAIQTPSTSQGTPPTLHAR